MSINFGFEDPKKIVMAHGTKQNIAQAMYEGRVHPTPGLLAAMLIDARDRDQAIKAGGQPTVLQQVLGGGGSPMPSPQGLGANPAMPPPPPQMPPMAPPQGMPPQGMAPPQAMPPQGMAMGGVASLPVPDAMFDEPMNGGFGDGYAGGGLVAFADGGDIDFDRFRQAIIAQESSGDYGAINKDSGAMGAYQFMEPTARAIAKRLGLPYRPDLLTGRSKEAKAYQDKLGAEQLKDAIEFGGGDIGRAGIYHFAGPDEKGWGPKTRQYKKDIMRRYTGSKDSGKVPERDVNTAQGRTMSRGDIYEELQSRFGPDEREKAATEALYNRAKEKASDEYYEKQRKASVGFTLAEMGFNMASSKSPYLLQAIGEAGAAAMPGARADKKEREALKDRALGLMVDLGAKDRKEALQLYGIAVDVAKDEISQERFQQELEFKRTEGELDRALQREIEKARAARAPTSDLETMIAIQQSGTPEQKAALIETLKLKQQYGGGSGTAAGSIEGVLGLGGGSAGAQPEVVNLGGIE